MYAKSFEDRLDRLNWKPGAVPTHELIDSLLRSPAPAQGSAATIAGGICGILAGLGARWLQAGGLETAAAQGTAGIIAALLLLLAACAAPVLALAGAVLHRRFPKLLQFSGLYLLVTAAAVVS